MAIVKLTAGKINPRIIINYVCNKEKTTDKLIGGKDCMAESAEYEFEEVKKAFSKTDGRTYYHMIQSFSPEDDITPEQAHEVGLQMADLFQGYQVVVATHINKEHIHNHLVINSVNYENGKKLTVSNQELENIKKFSNDICMCNGWATTEPKTRRYDNPKWKKRIQYEALEAMKNSYTMEQFIDFLSLHGIKVSYNKDYRYMTYTDASGHKCRDSKLFDERLLKKNLELYFDMGGADTIIADTVINYETPMAGNCTDGLTNSIIDFVANLPQEEMSNDWGNDIIESRLLDIMVEKMKAHGVKITKSQLAHIRNSNQNEEQEMQFGMFM